MPALALVVLSALELRALIKQEVRSAVSDEVRLAFTELAGESVPADSWLDTAGAVKWTGFSRSTLARRRQNGSLPFVAVGGKARYKRSDLDALMVGSTLSIRHAR